MKNQPRVSIIVAMASNRVIGKDNQLPWYLPADLQHFKRLTLGHHILMGRKTYDSIGKPLPGRTTVIITRQAGIDISGCLIAHSVEEAIQLGQNDDELFFIGGAELFRQALDKTDRIYLTEIHAEFTGDTYFPELDPQQWQEKERVREVSSEGGFNYDFVIYERR